MKKAFFFLLLSLLAVCEDPRAWDLLALPIGNCHPLLMIGKGGGEEREWRTGEFFRFFFFLSKKKWWKRTKTR